jgi:CRP/FNR family cyclic AMP-dependent transcriptional regulator
MMSEFSMEARDILKGSALLKRFSDDDFERLLALSTLLNYDEEDIILTENEVNDCLYIIISGTVTLYKTNHRTKTEHVITTLSQGESLREMGVIENRPCSVTVKANGPSVLLSVSIMELRRPENMHCYDALLEGIISIVTHRLALGNESLAMHLYEKTKKRKQLYFALATISILVILFIELGVGAYYLWGYVKDV